MIQRYCINYGVSNRMTGCYKRGTNKFQWSISRHYPDICTDRRRPTMTFFSCCRLTEIRTRYKSRMRYRSVTLPDAASKLTFNFPRVTNTVLPWFTSLIRSSKTVSKAKTRKTKINLQSLPGGNNDRFARGRSSYKLKLARKLKNRY
jgi:hypothetical protein